MSQRKRTKVSFGEELQRARVSRGFAVSEVAKELNIPARQLEALEMEELEMFAAPVYAHGALRAYAAWLNISDKKLERLLSYKLRGFADQTDLKVHTLPRWHERILSGKTVLTGVGVLLAGIVGSYVIWQVNSFWQLPKIEISSPESSIVEGGQVVIGGKTESDVRIRINGEPIMLREGNAFEQVIPVLPGITVVRIEGENAAGRVRVVERHLLHPRGPIASGS